MDTLTINKERVLGILKEFPDSVNINDFINDVTIIAKVEKARDQINNGEYLTEEELDKEIKRWD